MNVMPMDSMFINKLVLKTFDNKAIRDGNYLARLMPVLGNVHRIKIENYNIVS